MNYLIVAARDLEEERLRTVVEERFSTGGEVMPTIAERWMQQGVRRGEGLVVERLLRRRFGSLPGWAEERLAGAEAAELEQWADRLLDAPSLEAVFREGERH